MNYFEHFLGFVSAIRGYVSISTFTALVGVFVGTASSAVALKICVTQLSRKIGRSMIK